MHALEHALSMSILSLWPTTSLYISPRRKEVILYKLVRPGGDHAVTLMGLSSGELFHIK